MDRSATRLLVVSLIVYAVAFLFFVVTSLFELMDRDLLQPLQAQWIVYDAAIDTIAHAIALQVFAILLCYSLLLRTRDVRTTGASTFYSFIRGGLVLLMLLTALYTAASLIFEPQFRQGRQTLEYRSEIAHTYRARGMAAFEQGDYDRAVRNLERYFTVQRADAEAREILDSARTEVAAARGSQSAPAEEIEAVQGAENLTIGELLDRAQRFIEEEDYFSAHYYASLALEQRPGFEPAQRLVTEARRGISGADLSEQEEQEQQRYRRMREGYEALYTDNNPIEAYNIFLQLRDEVPQDPDVRRYFQEAVRRVQNITFFLDEIQDIAVPPVANDVLIEDRGDEGIRQFVHIESLYRLPRGSYAERVEVIAVTPEWEVAYHFMAPYAKFLESHLALRAIERENPNNQVTPTYYRDERPEELQYVLRLGASPLELQQAGTDLANAGLLTLWRMSDLFPRVGFPTEPVYVELGMRLIQPFSFLVLAVFGIAVSWRWRSRYISRPPLPALILLPAVPLVLNYFTALFLYGQRVVATFSLLTFGVTSGFVVLVAFQGLLVIVALVVLAMQVRE